MADVDEDVISPSGPQAEDTDLTDETQDFRFLSSISTEDAKIPKRGEKDFEPHATALQSNTLAASRQAMHTALSFQRVHNPKGYTRATYHPESNMAYAVNPKGPLFLKMGQVFPADKDPLGNDIQRGQRMWLLPEEVLYMLERGTLDVRWPVGEGDVEGVGLEMSLQGAYAMFIGDDQESHEGKLTFERYSVYAGLKRMGYTVKRAPSWESTAAPPGPECYPPPAPRTWQTGFNHWFKTLFAAKPLDVTEQQVEGPLVQPGLYRNYAEIYRRLSLINYHDPTTLLPTTKLSTTADPAFQITFHVWKPGSSTFKKTAPGEPDFRVAVVDARETSMPTLDQLNALLESTPYAPPMEKAQTFQKLKLGYKNAILAVVDQGVTSYLRVSDAAFGREKMYERNSRPAGGKRGGRGGGRGGRGGRGRGR